MSNKHKRSIFCTKFISRFSDNSALFRIYFGLIGIILQMFFPEGRFVWSWIDYFPCRLGIRTKFGILEKVLKSANKFSRPGKSIENKDNKSLGKRKNVWSFVESCNKCLIAI